MAHVNSLRQALRTATQETDDVREESEDSIHIIAFFILEIGILSLEFISRVDLTLFCTWRRQDGG